jgi:hypothetical protein
LKQLCGVVPDVAAGLPDVAAGLQVTAVLHKLQREQQRDA